MTEHTPDTFRHRRAHARGAKCHSMTTREYKQNNAHGQPRQTHALCADTTVKNRTLHTSGQDTQRIPEQQSGSFHIACSSAKCWVSHGICFELGTRCCASNGPHFFFFEGHSSGGHLKPSQEPFLTVGFSFLINHVFTFHLHYLNIQRCDFLSSDSFGKIYEF